MWITVPQTLPSSMSMLPLWDVNKTPQLEDLLDDKREGGELLDGDDDVVFLSNSSNFNGNFVRTDSLWSTQLANLPDIKIEPGLPETTDLTLEEWGEEMKTQSQGQDRMFPLDNIKIEPEPTLPDVFGDELDLPDLFEEDETPGNNWEMKLPKQKGMTPTTPNNIGLELPQRMAMIPLTTTPSITRSRLPQRKARMPLTTPSSELPQSKIPKVVKREKSRRKQKLNERPDPNPYNYPSKYAPFIPFTPSIQVQQVTTTTTPPFTATRIPIPTPPARVNFTFHQKRQVKNAEPRPRKIKSYLYQKLIEECRDDEEWKQVARAINTKNFHERRKAREAAANTLLAKLLPVAQYLLDENDRELLRNYFLDVFNTLTL